MMKWRNTSDRYGLWQIGFHWAMLLLMAAVYAFMELRGVFFAKGSDGNMAMKQWHYMLGLSVMALTVVHLAVRWTMPHPRIQPAPPAWQMWLSGAMHALLYLFMLGMPLAGWLMFSAAGKPVPFFGFELPALIGENDGLAGRIKELHIAVANIGYAMVGLHAAAALFHHYWKRDDTLRRMLPWRGVPERQPRATPTPHKPPLVGGPGFAPRMANE